MLDVFLSGARGLGLTDIEYHQVVQFKVARWQHPADLARIT